MPSKELERQFTLKQLQAYNGEIRSKYNDLKFQYNYLKNNQEVIIKKEVAIRTKEYTDCY